MSANGGTIDFMSMTLQNTALIATIAAPVVASLIFLGTVIYDRGRRQREAWGQASSKALGSLTTAAKWSMWPYPIAALGSWQVDALADLGALAIQLPRRRYEPLALWLVAGGTYVGQEHDFDRRTDALGQLVGVLVQMHVPSRKGLDAAQSLARAHPWPEGPPAKPTRYKVLSQIGLWPLRILSLDTSYGRRTTG